MKSFYTADQILAQLRHVYWLDIVEGWNPSSWKTGSPWTVIREVLLQVKRERVEKD